MDMHPPPVLEERVNHGFCAVRESLRKVRALWLQDCSEDGDCNESTKKMLRYPVEKIVCSSGTPVEEEVEKQRMFVTPDYQVELHSSTIRFVDDDNIRDAIKSSPVVPILFYTKNIASKELALLAGLIAQNGYDVFAYSVVSGFQSVESQTARVCADYNTGKVPALIYYDRNLKKLDTDLHITGSLRDSKYFSDNKPISEQYRTYLSKVRAVLK
jgi:hypothetical protein